MNKITAVPDMGLVIGGYGDGNALIQWSSFVAMSGHWGGIEEANQRTIEYLPLMYDALKPDHPLKIIMVGWCHIQHRPIGYMYDDESNFASLNLLYGHTLHPSELDYDDPDYEKLASIWRNSI
jgi:hypothetical protein